MKGSIGVGSTIGRSTGSLGTRASGTTLGAKSLGGSFSSPEARFGGNASAFSSRALSMFNRDVISKPISPVINPNFGRDVKSPFARSSNLAPKGIFDIAKPISKNTIVPHEAKASRPSIGLSIHRGTDAKSNVARTPSLAPRSIFDISKPVSKNNLTGRKEAIRPDAFKKVAIDVKARSFRPDIKRHVSIIEHKTRVKPLKRVELKHIVRVSSAITPEATNLVYKDIKDAKKMIPVIMKARGVSHGAAVAEMVGVLGKKHEGKIVITPYEPQVQPDASLEAQPSPSTDVKTKADKAVQAENVESNMSLQVGSIDAKTASKPTNPNEKPREYYYFAKDKDTNNTRKERIASAFKRLIVGKANVDHEEKTEVTGWDLQMALWEKPKDNELSEITRPIQKDESLKRLLDTVKFLGQVIDLQMLHNVLENLIERYPAIKLTKDKDEGMKGKDAEQVYGQILSFVPASTKGQSEIGVLDAASDTARLILLKQDGKKPRHQQIIYKEAA